jgi:hypothetical protein
MLSLPKEALIAGPLIFSFDAIALRINFFMLLFFGKTNRDVGRTI